MNERELKLVEDLLDFSKPITPILYEFLDIKEIIGIAFYKFIPNTSNFRKIEESVRSKEISFENEVSYDDILEELNVRRRYIKGLKAVWLKGKGLLKGENLKYPQLILALTLPTDPDIENLLVIAFQQYTKKLRYKLKRKLITLYRILQKNLEVKNKFFLFDFMVNTLGEIAQEMDVDTIISKVVDKIKEVVGSEGASILLKDEKTGELYFRKVSGERGEIITKIKIPKGKGICGYVADAGEIVVSNDVTKDPRFYSKVDEKSEFKTKSILAVPIKAFNQIIGVMEVVNKLKEREYNENDIYVALTFSSIVAPLLQNALLQEKNKRMFISIIQAMIKALEAKDPYTAGHTERVKEYSIKLAIEIGLPREEIKKVELSALLHDIGKIGISDSILNKKGPLTPEEYEEIKKHPVIGAQILEPIEGLDKEVIYGVKYHHERWDGSGYPEGLKGEEIPLIARIVSIADVYDALASDRSYRKRLPLQVIKEELIKGAGKSFDPYLIQKFLEILEREK